MVHKTSPSMHHHLFLKNIKIYDIINYKIKRGDK